MYEAIIILLGGRPATSNLPDDKDAMGMDGLGFQTISGDEATRLATS